MCHITTKLILAYEKDVFIKEIGQVHNWTLNFKGFTHSSHFKTINVMYTLCYSVRPLLQHSKNKQKAYIKAIQELLTQDARSIIPEFKGTDSDLS